ncbi:Chitinase 1 [Mortierella polycephala]|uniref:Chitinase 1 n=1 Tax=Mortierella polycephala TaxID=41804 RepID=A0A9P6Q2F5_9FUNG|nr:Chitinase 1 [Mortierella polycephala]
MISEHIKACQARGNAAVISIGGATGSYSLPNAQPDQAFTDQVWNTFLDLWPLSSRCTASSRLRVLVSIISRQPYPDQAMRDTLASSWFDLVWVQFYNDYCGVDNFGTHNFNFATWNYWVTTISTNKNVRILLGLPSSLSAAYTSDIDANQLNTILDAVQSYSNFGGVMMWDVGVALKSSLATSTSKFLCGSGSLEISESPRLPAAISISAITLPMVGFPRFSAPLFPTLTTTLIISKAIPTMRLIIPNRDAPLEVSVNVQNLTQVET